jgi:hypothetical protein
MRVSLLVASVSFASLAALAVACGSTDTAADPEEDAGTSSGSSGRRPGTSSGDPGSSSGTADGGSSSGSSGASGSSGNGGALLKQGTAILLDVTSDGQVVYLAANGSARTLESVPATGGQQTVIDANFDTAADEAAVSGGVVGVWKAVAANRLGTFGVWTKASGLKTSIATNSVATLIAGSPDGSRVAFGVNGAAGANGPTNTDLAVTSTATPAGTAVFTGTTASGTGVNLAATKCSPDIGFVGKRLFAAHCSGSGTGSTAARLYTLGETDTTPTRLDASGGAAGTIKSSWIADKAGTKVFATASAAASTGFVFDIAKASGPALATLDTAVTGGFFNADGSAFIYRTTADGIAGVRRASVSAAPAPITLVADAELLDVNAARDKMLVSVVAPQNKLVDIRLADTSSANQTPTALVPTATAQPLGFTTGGTHALYVTDASQTGNKLKAKPVAGGAEVLVAENIANFATGPGGWVVVLDNPKDISQGVTVYDLKIVDLTKGTTLVQVADTVTETIGLNGTKLVYARLAAQGGGIFAVDLP